MDFNLYGSNGNILRPAKANMTLRTPKNRKDITVGKCQKIKTLDFVLSSEK